MDDAINGEPREVTLYTDGKGRWLKRVWAAQCPETILLNDRCQGMLGHQGDHWCFRPDGAYHFKPHASDPKREQIGCGTTPPGNAEYRTPLEMTRHHYLNHYEDAEVTDPSELVRLERGELNPHENVNRPCTPEEMEQLRKLGRLETDDRLSRRERAAELKYRPMDFSAKSTTGDIAKRFDSDVERFSNLETGQSATIDAPLSMQLITEAAVRQADLRDADLPKESYDVILAAAVLHHLRDDADWQAAFEKVYSLLRPGGSFWITDLVVQETVPIHELMWSRYGDYLEGMCGAEYRQKVFDYIEREDSPRPVTYQLDLLRRVGFTHVELLHKNSCFAAFGAWKE
jgi:SAM-dependent methyltransferase